MVAVPTCKLTWSTLFKTNNPAKNLSIPRLFPSQRTKNQGLLLCKGVFFTRTLREAGRENRSAWRTYLTANFHIKWRLWTISHHKILQNRSFWFKFLKKILSKVVLRVTYTRPNLTCLLYFGFIIISKCLTCLLKWQKFYKKLSS